MMTRMTKIIATSCAVIALSAPAAFAGNTTKSFEAHFEYDRTASAADLYKSFYKTATRYCEASHYGGLSRKLAERQCRDDLIAAAIEQTGRSDMRAMHNVKSKQAFRKLAKT